MAQPWMDLAWKQTGQHEISGAAANPEIIKFFADAGYPNVHSDEVPWCAAFACAMLERAGIRSPRTLLARGFLNFGTPVDTPRVGAIAVFSRPPSLSSGHVGFVAGDTPDAIVLLGGNQSDSVSVIHMPKARLLGLRWPAPGLDASDLKESGSRIITHADKSIGAQAAAVAAGASGIAASQAPDHTSSLAGVAAKATEYKAVASALIDVGHFLSHTWLWIAALLAAYFGGKAIWHAYQVKQARTDDHNTGAHSGSSAIAQCAEPLIGATSGGPNATP